VIYLVIDRGVLSLAAMLVTLLLVLPAVVLYELLRRYRGGSRFHWLTISFCFVWLVASLIVLSDAVAHWLDLVA